MNFLDIRTIAFSHLVTTTLCALLMVMVWRQNRYRFAGTDFWLAEFVLHALGLFLLILRGNVPDWISIVLANSMIVGGAILGYVGQERFLEKKSTQVHNFVLLGIFVLIHGYFSLIEPSLMARNFNSSVALLLICVQSVWLMWHRIEPARRKLTFGVGAVHLIYCLICAIRIYYIASGGEHAQEQDYFKPILIEALFLLSFQAIFIGLTYSLIGMVNKRLLMQITNEEEKFSKTFHSAPYAISLTRQADGTIMDVNEAFESLSGYERTELIGQKALDLNLWERVADRNAVLNALASNGTVRGIEASFRQKGGERIFGIFSAELIAIDGENVIVSSIEDITERKRMEDQVRQLAFNDGLTALPNRRLLLNRLSQAVAASKRSGRYSALLFMDLDHFKALNDTHGHAAGDLLLIEVANRLRKRVREMDTVARFGGDEFVILLGDLSPDKSESTQLALGIAEKVRVTIAAPYLLDCQHDAMPTVHIEHHCTASIGLVIFGGADCTEDEVLQQADAAMYQAKDAGHNRVQLFEPLSGAQYK